ncbi:MAG: hypothetical protein KY462_06120 [Actinobacteria bacterium]|nr:hypothetical protein [Actinomycetota bacterium]
MIILAQTGVVYLAVDHLGERGLRSTSRPAVTGTPSHEVTDPLRVDAPQRSSPPPVAVTADGVAGGGEQVSGATSDATTPGRASAGQRSQPKKNADRGRPGTQPKKNADRGRPGTQPQAPAAPQAPPRQQPPAAPAPAPAPPPPAPEQPTCEADKPSERAGDPACRGNTADPGPGRANPPAPAGKSDDAGGSRGAPPGKR